MCFSLCKRPITLDILFPILVKAETAIKCKTQKIKLKETLRV